jgi:hypothetical protein
VESSCELGNEPSGSIKCWELPSAAQLVASRAVLSSTELVSSMVLLTGIEARSLPYCHLFR